MDRIFFAARITYWYREAKKDFENKLDTCAYIALGKTLAYITMAEITNTINETESKLLKSACDRLW